MKVKGVPFKFQQSSERTSHQFFSTLPIPINPIDLKQLELDRRNRLGSGNFGMVYRGVHNGTEVAVKEIPINAREKDRLSEMIINEINVSNQVRHPNITRFMG